MRKERKTAGAFDIRLIIGLLFAIYGAVVMIVGLLHTSPDDIAKSANLNINLWSGIGMLIFAAVFGLWVKWRPIVVSKQPSADDTSRH